MPLPISPTLTTELDTCRTAQVPLLLVGPHGIGKSQFVETWAEARGLPCVVLDLSLLEPQDLQGLPYRDEHVTRYAAPAELPQEGPCVLVFEELNRCDRAVRQPTLQLLTARKLNSYRLPADTTLVACINPDDDTYEVDALDPALLDRFVRLEVEASLTHWTRWAKQQGLPGALLAFLGRHPKVFTEASPRSWEQASRLLVAGLRAERPARDLVTLLGAKLGERVARALVSELAETPDTLTPTQILQRPQDAAQRVRTWTSLGRLDLVASTFHALEAHLAANPVSDPERVLVVLDAAPEDLALPLLDAIEQAAK